MTKTAQQEPGANATVTALPTGRQLPDVTQQIVDFNSASKAHEDLWSDTRQATDLASQARSDAERADAAAAEAELGFRAALARKPGRRAPRLRQRLIAGGTLALDGVACYFAAEALNGSQTETLAWAALFLALLGAAELALDHYRDTSVLIWRWLVAAIGAFTGLLGLLRYSFLITVGAEGMATALVGATLFSVATAGFVIAGYRALRVAQTHEAAQARKAVRVRASAAAAAHRRLAQCLSERDLLASAYLSRIRTRLIKGSTAESLPLLEQAVLAHLISAGTS